MADVLFINGRFTTTDERVIGVEDRGFQFGDAVYEVFKFVGRKPRLMGEHSRRREDGLRALELRSPWEEIDCRGVIGELLEQTTFDDGI
ncbi:MAG: dat, partial [Acidobacteria bacterium]|nr:dat [Acidobacteriota bacterium]